MSGKVILNWIKKEAVLTVAIFLAVVSAFFVHPDKEYLEYIDFRTLVVLFCLMAVMAGLQQIGLFQYVGERLVARVHSIRCLVFILVMLCFFCSMLITNDVALITFVPFSLIVLRMVLGENAEKLMVPVVVMQTLAANLGSMLTPIGNPQNLFLYGKADMHFGAFMLFMLPYALLAFVLLTVCCMVFPYHGEKHISVTLTKKTYLWGSEWHLIIYGLLFVFCLLEVANLLPYMALLFVVAASIFVVDKSIFKKVDYALLFTFVGFFIFIGNMGRVPAFKALLQSVIEGDEVLTAVLSSQFMSNVPAALLLSGFTERYDLLLIGTNLGGLGTLIASMASLISYKYVAQQCAKQKGRYLLLFTVANILFLVVLYAFYLFVGK